MTQFNPILPPFAAGLRANTRSINFPGLTTAYVGNGSLQLAYPFSVFMWMRKPNWTTDQGWFWTYAGAVSGVLAIGSRAASGWEFDGGAAGVTFGRVTNLNINNNAWFSFGISMPNGNVTSWIVVIDGITRVLTTGGSGAATLPVGFRVGFGPSTAHPAYRGAFAGNIANVGRWTRSLSATEYAALHAAGSGYDLRKAISGTPAYSPANLVNMWRFEEGQGTVAYDEVGSVNFNMIGTVSWSTAVPA